MLDELKGVLYYLTVNLRGSFIIFWSILLSMLVVIITISKFVTVSTYFFMSFPIYFFAMAAGYMIVKGAIPYLIQMSAVRKTIFTGVAIYFVCLALMNAIIANTVLQGINYLTGNEITNVITYKSANNGSVIWFNHIADFIGNTWFSRIVVDAAVMIVICVVAFILGLIYYRFGIIGLCSTIGAFAIFIIFSVTRESFLEKMKVMYENFNIHYFYSLIGFGMVLYLLSFVLFRKITIKG